MLCQVLEYCF